MKHRVKIKHFNRDTKSRKALLRNLLRFLIEHGHIETTESRAKEVRRLADKLIVKAQVGDLKARRELHKFFGKRDVVNTLVDKIVPALGDRKTGFCGLEKLSSRRGDNVTVYRLSLLVKEKTWSSLHKESKKVVTKKVETKKTPVKKTVTKKSAVKKAPKAKKEETK